MNKIIALHSLIANLEAQGCWGMAESLRNLMILEIENYRAETIASMADADKNVELAAS